MLRIKEHDVGAILRAITALDMDWRVQDNFVNIIITHKLAMFDVEMKGNGHEKVDEVIIILTKAAKPVPPRLM